MAGNGTTSRRYTNKLAAQRTAFLAKNGLLTDASGKALKNHIGFWVDIVTETDVHTINNNEELRSLIRDEGFDPDEVLQGIEVPKIA